MRTFQIESDETGTFICIPLDDGSIDFCIPDSRSGNPLRVQTIPPEDLTTTITNIITQLEMAIKNNSLKVPHSYGIRLIVTSVDQPIADAINDIEFHMYIVWGEFYDGQRCLFDVTLAKPGPCGYTFLFSWYTDTDSTGLLDILHKFIA